MGAKHYQATENVLKAAADINSKSEAVYFGLAVAQTKSNKKTDAIASPVKATETDANSERSLLLLGVIQRDIQEI